MINTKSPSERRDEHVEFPDKAASGGPPARDSKNQHRNNKGRATIQTANSIRFHLCWFWLKAMRLRRLQDSRINMSRDREDGVGSIRSPAAMPIRASDLRDSE